MLFSSLFEALDEKENSRLKMVENVLFWCLRRLTDEMGFEPVTVESLRADKVFVKLVKKQQKELESLNKVISTFLTVIYYPVCFCFSPF